MIKTLVNSPYCPACGKFRPDGLETTMCIPCANTGHSSRLVMDESDRCARVAVWLRFYAEQEYSAKEIKSIPWFSKYLNGRTFSREGDKRQ